MIKLRGITFLLLACVSMSQNVLAQSPADAPTAVSPPPPVAEGQFQQWLQSNGLSQAPRSPQYSADMPQPPRVLKQPLTYEQSQQVMLNSAPPSNVPSVPDANVAFDMMLQKNII